REPGFDWCIVRLGLRGIVRGVDVDTAFFKGNFPEACALDGCAELDSASWIELLPRTPLAGDTHNLFAIENALTSTHVRLRIFPDGGVARLRVYGDVTPDWSRLREHSEVDLAAIEHGGVVVGCSDMFFGS